MHDQAKSLRQLVHQAPLRSARTRPLITALTGAKGGVGTTTVALGLAVEMVCQGHSALLVDADPDGGDVATLCRLPDRWTVADVLAGHRTVEEALQPGPGGLSVLAGAWGLDLMAECSAATHERLVGQLRALAAKVDLVLVDVGSGTSHLVRRWWRAADQVLLVTTPELPAVMDAYATIKVLSGGNGRLRLRSVVNLCDGATQAADVHARLARACARFLGIRLVPAGHLPCNPRLVQPGAKLRELTALAKAIGGGRRGSTCLQRACSHPARS